MTPGTLGDPPVTPPPRILFFPTSFFQKLHQFLAGPLCCKRRGKLLERRKRKKKIMFCDVSGRIFGRISERISGVLRVRNVSAFSIQLCWRAAPRAWSSFYGKKEDKREQE